MNLNVTLLIQACNFFVVYWMLRAFLFRPVIAIINNEHAETATLMNIIGQQKKSIEIQEKERQHAWYTCREYFKSRQILYQASIMESFEDIPVLVNRTTSQEIE